MKKKLGSLLATVALMFSLESCSTSTYIGPLTNPPRESFVFMHGDAPVVSMVHCDKGDSSSCTFEMGDGGLNVSASGVVIANSRTHRGVQYVMTAGHVCTIDKEYEKSLRSHYESKGDSVMGVMLDIRLTVQDNEANKYRAKVVGISEEHDLCILAIKGSHLRTAHVAGHQVKEGTKVYNLAAPLGIWQPGTTNKFIGYYSGVYTCEAKDIPSFPIPCTPGRPTWSLFTLSATGGSSGSPIFNKMGEVIGIVSMVPGDFQEIVFAVRLEDMQNLYHAVLDHEKTEAGASDIDFDAPGLVGSTVVRM